jgi:hypothetical protein
MSGTAICPRCNRSVPWTEQEWDTAKGCCRHCAADNIFGPVQQGAARAVEPRLASPKQVVLTGIEIPYWSLVGFSFKSFFAGIPLAIALLVTWFVLSRIIEFLES